MISWNSLKLLGAREGVLFFFFLNKLEQENDFYTMQGLKTFHSFIIC